MTHTALVTTSILQRIRTHKPSPFLDLMVTLLMFFADTYRTVFRWAIVLLYGISRKLCIGTRRELWTKVCSAAVLKQQGLPP